MATTAFNANYYLLTATSLAAGAVLTPQGPGAPLLLVAMAYAVTRYATSPGADFGLAMVFATYVFQMTTVVLLRRSSDTSKTKLPRTGREWLVLAFTNPRFIGWGWERPLERRASKSRTAFLLRYGRDFVVACVVLDACHAYFASNAWFAHDAPLQGKRIGALPLGEQYANAAVWGVYAYLLWFLPYTVIVLATVATGICRPEDYPVLCAPFSQASSLRGFWGRVWHQSNRNTYSVLGDALCSQAWGRDRRPYAAKYVKIAAAFGISGIVHAAGSLALRPNPVTGTRDCSGAILFFALQAIGVAIENVFVDILRVRTRLPRWLGYAWVAAWCCTTLIYSGWLDEMVARQSIQPAQSILLHAIRST